MVPTPPSLQKSGNKVTLSITLKAHELTRSAAAAK
jgi:hypothetical protein